MYDLVKERLTALGYEFKKADEAILKSAVGKTESGIKNRCGVSEIPDGLLDAAIDTAAGEFLFAKKALSPEDINIDLDMAVQRIEVGDTAAVFSVGEGSLTYEQRLDRFLERLLNSIGDQLFRYRRIRW